MIQCTAKMLQIIIGLQNVHLPLLLVDLCFNTPKAGKFILVNLIGGK